MIAERLLTTEEQQSLAAQFDEMEEKKMGRETHARLHARMKEFASEISQGQMVR